MGEVAVHGDQGCVAVGIGPADPRQVRASDSRFGGAMEHVDGGTLLAQSIKNLTGSIRRVVIEKEDVCAEITLQNLVADFLHIFPLVVGRNENERMRGGWR